ncbi:MAG: hypothetical protein ACK53Y_10600, partial [bacterium]
GCPRAMPPSAAERKKLHISLKNLNGRHRFRKAMLTSKVYVWCGGRLYGTQKVDNFSGKNEAETPSNLVVSLVSV